MNQRTQRKTQLVTADALNQVDLCLVVDTTGSMGSFLGAARQHLRAAMEALCADSGIDLHVGLVEYRDHPPQDRTFVTRCYPLTANLKTVQKVINDLKADGGGDSPEAVYDGLRDACEKTAWRRHSLRFALLVGDAPPQGAAAHGGQGRPCACGMTLHDATAVAERHSVAVHAVCMTGGATQEAFAAIAQGTGGTCVLAQNANSVVEKMTGVLRQEFSSLDFDHKTLDAARAVGEIDTARIAESLGETRRPVAASLARLTRRNLLDDLLPTAA